LGSLHAPTAPPTYTLSLHDALPICERAIYERMIAENPGPLTAEQVKRIFTEIISACRALEHLPRIAFLGLEHTYSYEAARLRFGDRKSTRLNSSHVKISYAVFCLKK